MDIQYLPNNGNSLQEKKTESKEPEKERAVVVKKATKREVVKDDVNKMLNYVSRSILLPALKNTISSMVSNGIDMLLFGEVKSRRTDDGRSRVVDYNGASRRGTSSPIVDNRRSDNINYRDIEVMFKEDAEDIEREVRAYFDKYHVLSMSNYFNIIGGEFRKYADYTKQSVGWYDLSKFYIVENRDRGTWSLIMPNAIVL